MMCISSQFGFKQIKAFIGMMKMTIEIKTNQSHSSEQDLTDYILNSYVLKAAADWKNRRIEAYLDRT